MAICTRRSVLEVKLSYDGECLRSVLDVGKDILIVPQASIGGKLKGKSVQWALYLILFLVRSQFLNMYVLYPFHMDQETRVTPGSGPG